MPITILAGHLAEATRRCALAMPSHAIIPITEFVLIDASLKEVVAITEQAGYRCAVDIHSGAGQALLHKSTFSTIKALPPDTPITITDSGIKWPTGKMVTPVDKPDQYPAWQQGSKAGDVGVPGSGDVLISALSRAAKVQNGQEPELSIFHPVWLIGDSVCAGSHHSVTSIPSGVNASAGVGLPRGMMRAIEQWVIGDYYLLSTASRTHFTSISGDWAFFITATNQKPPNIAALIDNVSEKLTGGSMEGTDAFTAAIRMVASAVQADYIIIDFVEDRIALSGTSVTGVAIDQDVIVPGCSIKSRLAVNQHDFMAHLGYATHLHLALNTIVQNEQPVTNTVLYFSGDDGERGIMAPTKL